MELASEAAYARAWRSLFTSREQWQPYDLAKAGGACAGNLAHVFIAGYQGAIRATFPDVSFSGWAAFAVSEDRSATNPLPGVTAQAAGDALVLNGNKSWVAAVDHVDDLVVRASGAAAGYYLIARATPGLSLERNPAPSMLPSLSQGRAGLHDVRLVKSHKLDSARVPRFAATEAYCIYVAFAAFAVKLVTGAITEVSSRELAEMALGLLDRAAGQDFADDAEAMADFDNGIQRLRQRLSETICCADENWLRDQKLIAMYSKSIQARIA